MVTKALQIIFLGLMFGQSHAMAQCANTSNIYSFTHNGRNYEIVRELKTWANAAACAVERGGTLVEINDESEQLAVHNAIASAGVSTAYTSIANGGGIAYVWIGASDQLNEDKWMWDGNNDNNGSNFWTGQGDAGAGNGSSVDGLYHNWGGKSTSMVQEPDNFGSGQHHAAIALTGWPSGTNFLGIAGEWNDIIGSSLLYFTIEKNSNVGINEVKNHSEINVYPNPCSDKIVIESDKNLYGINFRIYDIAGKLVKQDIFKEKNEIITVNLNKGIYILQLIEESYIINAIKFVKE
jgi:hypothetical protein